MVSLVTNSFHWLVRALASRSSVAVGTKIVKIKVACGPQNPFEYESTWSEDSNNTNNIMLGAVKLPCS